MHVELAALRGEQASDLQVEEGHTAPAGMVSPALLSPRLIVASRGIPPPNMGLWEVVGSSSARATRATTCPGSYSARRGQRPPSPGCQWRPGRGHVAPNPRVDTLAAPQGRGAGAATARPPRGSCPVKPPAATHQANVHGTSIDHLLHLPARSSAPAGAAGLRKRAVPSPKRQAI